MNVPAIIAAAAEHYGLKPKDIRGQVRQSLRTRTRNLAIRMLAGIGDLDVRSIAACMDCDHATVSKALKETISDRQHAFEQDAWTAAGNQQVTENLLAFPGPFREEERAQ